MIRYERSSLLFSGRIGVIFVACLKHKCSGGGNSDTH